MATHAAAQKNLVAAAKAYDRAVIFEARAAEKLSAIKEKITLKGMKGGKSEFNYVEPPEAEGNTAENPQSGLIIVETEIIEAAVFEPTPSEDLEP
jgi:hypothetical protein